MKITFQAKKIYQVVGLFALCLGSFGAGLLLNGAMRSPDEKLLDSTFRVIRNDSLFNQQTGRELSYAAIRGMLSTIHDPYAELIEPKAAQNFANTFAGQTGVVGLYAENKAGLAVITLVYPNTPAQKAGIHIGDVIHSIDNVPLDSDADSSEIGLMLRGLPDTIVHLKILHGDQYLQYDLTREVQKFVTSSMLPDGIGYIASYAFNQTASQQMKEALQSLLAQNPTGLIWDLRNNEGGDMQAAQEMLSLFIKDGLLFSAELTQGRTFKFNAKGKPVAAEIPLVALIDKTSYSAAEACAAAISETGRGKTIGSTSFGKGVIQATIPLVDNSMLQMTIARWRSPNGEWYQDRGVPPQIEVIDDPNTETDELLQTAVELLLGN